MKYFLAIISLFCVSACGSLLSPEVIDIGLGRKAPPVPRALDASGLLADPCTVFSGNLTVVRIQKTGQGETPGCKMITGGEKPLTIDILFFPKISNGLEHVYEYRRRDAWKNGYFEPVIVAGFPAVYAANVDRRPAGECDLSVALTDQLFFAVLAHSRSGGTGCEFAIAIASSVIEKLNHAQ